VGKSKSLYDGGALNPGRLFQRPKESARPCDARSSEFPTNPVSVGRAARATLGVSLCYPSPPRTPKTRANAQQPKGCPSYCGSPSAVAMTSKTCSVVSSWDAKENDKNFCQRVFDASPIGGACGSWKNSPFPKEFQDHISAPVNWRIFICLFM
jgi:hypothetical protein